MIKLNYCPNFFARRASDKMTVITQRHSPSRLLTAVHGISRCVEHLIAVELSSAGSHQGIFQRCLIKVRPTASLDLNVSAESAVFLLRKEHCGDYSRTPPRLTPSVFIQTSLIKSSLPSRLVNAGQSGWKANFAPCSGTSTQTDCCVYREELRIAIINQRQHSASAALNRAT